MNSSIVILVIAFWGIRELRSLLGEILLEKLLPATEKKGLKLVWKLISLIVGWGVFLLYVYFAGYYIMDKEASVAISLIIALAPNIVAYGYKLLTKSVVIE